MDETGIQFLHLRYLADALIQSHFQSARYHVFGNSANLTIWTSLLTDPIPLHPVLPSLPKNVLLKNILH
jgi:hypothetical protein